MSEVEPTASISPLQQMFSACSGALVTSVFVNPLDVVKIRMQQQVKQSFAWSSGKNTNVSKCTSWTPGDLYKKIVLKRYVTPLDVVKVRLQAQQRPMTAGRCFIYCNGLMDHLCICEPLNLNECTTYKKPMWYAKPGKFNGTLDALVKISRNEGITSLWSGLPPTLVMAVPATVVYFTLYDNSMFYLKRAYDYRAWMPVLSGGCARVACVTLISPLEMVRTKLQSEKLKYKDVWKAVRITTSQQGIAALWTGLGPTLLRDVPFSCMYWLFYETIKSRLGDELRHSKFTLSFISGAVAGSLAAIVTCPFDVIKTLRQVEIGELQSLKDYKSKPSSTWILLNRLYRKEGLNALFAGLTPRIIKVAPACAIMIGTYEYMKACFRERNKLLKASN